MAQLRHALSLSLLSPILLVLFLARTDSAHAVQVREPGDTTRTILPDTAGRDQLPSRFMANIGSMNQMTDSSSLLHSSQFIWTDAQQGGPVLQYVPGIFLRELGESGQPSQFHLDGIDGRGIAVTLDGRRLNDPWTGTYDLNLLPLEYIEQFELETGSRSGFYGNNATGAAINAVTRQYNSNSPITKIRYMQGPFEQILTDGLYTQNVARGVNVMLGFQRTASDGRYANSENDGWNVRTRVRYNYSDRWNFWISDLYARSVTGINGGLDASRSPSLFDEVTAVVRTEDASHTTSRRDVTMGGIAKLFADTTATTRAWLYYSTIDREYTEGDEAPDSVRIVDNMLLSFWGAQLEQQIDLGLAKFTFGGEYEHRSLEKNLLIPSATDEYAALKAQVSLSPLSSFTLSAFAREEFLREQNAISFGASASLSLSDWLSFSAGYSSVNRFATMQEYYWQTPAHTHNGGFAHDHDTEQAGMELHRQTELGVQFHADPVANFSLSGFQRTIEDAIVFQPLASTGTFPTATVAVLHESEIRGIHAALRLRYWNIEGRAAVTLLDHRQDQVEVRPVPSMTIHAEVSYRDLFFDGALEAKLGVRVKSLSSNDGLQFIPQQLLFTQQSVVRLAGWTALDLYTVFKLGDAFLTIAWENPLGVHYIITPVYPMPGSNFKFGINWVFLD